MRRVSSNCVLCRTRLPLFRRKWAARFRPLALLFRFRRKPRLCLRAVLRLPPEGRASALARMAKEGMTVAAAEAFVARLLAEKKPRPRHTGVIKDIRIFYNSIDRAVKLVRQAGIGVRSMRRESEDAIELVVRIEKKNTAR